jgi:hypothetical protein
MTATTEFVVPRPMPMILLMSFRILQERPPGVPAKLSGKTVRLPGDRRPERSSFRPKLLLNLSQLLSTLAGLAFHLFHNENLRRNAA